jgi:hypothetical protein
VEEVQVPVADQDLVLVPAGQREDSVWLEVVIVLVIGLEMVH